MYDTRTALRVDRYHGDRSFASSSRSTVSTRATASVAPVYKGTSTEPSWFGSMRSWISSFKRKASAPAARDASPSPTPGTSGNTLVYLADPSETGSTISEPASEELASPTLTVRSLPLLEEFRQSFAIAQLYDTPDLLVSEDYKFNRQNVDRPRHQLMAQQGRYMDFALQYGDPYGEAQQEEEVRGLVRVVVENMSDSTSTGRTAVDESAPLEILLKEEPSAPILIPGRPRQRRMQKKRELEMEDKELAHEWHTFACMGRKMRSNKGLEMMENKRGACGWCGKEECRRGLAEKVMRRQ